MSKVFFFRSRLLYARQQSSCKTYSTFNSSATSSNSSCVTVSARSVAVTPSRSAPISGV